MVQTVVTKTQLAARLGLTKGRITQFCKAGLPVRRDGKVDLDRALEWIAATRQTQGAYADRGVNRLARGLADGRQGLSAVMVADGTPEAAPAPAREGDATAATYAEARAVREGVMAQLAQLKLEVERGELIEVVTVKRDWIATLTTLRGRLLAVPARIAAALPHLSRSDIDKIGEEVHEALEELANAELA